MAAGRVEDRVGIDGAEPFVTQRCILHGVNWMADDGMGCVNTTCGVIIRKHAWQV